MSKIVSDLRVHLQVQVFMKKQCFLPYLFLHQSLCVSFLRYVSTWFLFLNGIFIIRKKHFYNKHQITFFHQVTIFQTFYSICFTSSRKISILWLLLLTEATATSLNFTAYIIKSLQLCHNFGCYWKFLSKKVTEMICNAFTRISIYSFRKINCLMKQDLLYSFIKLLLNIFCQKKHLHFA